MKILIVGSGGREHALAWRLAQSPSVTEVLAVPGNPGIAQLGRCLPAPPSLDAYTDLAASENVTLTVVGPEAPLVAGLVDRFRHRGLHIVGPTQSAARLEGSKLFAKAFFDRAGIPTARAFSTLTEVTYPVVIKADGLAAGKGVIIAQNRQEADVALQKLGPDVLFEEFLEGEEVSFIGLSNGREIIPFPSTQDHKRAYDNDEGPNTGGMGAYCDGRILAERQTGIIMDCIMQPAIRTMANDGSAFTGFLYAGLMMTASGPKILEFNVRLGDPETQVLMHSTGGDFAATLLAAAAGETLSPSALPFTGPSACVVAAAANYPDQPRLGDPITGLDQASQFATVFHAGTRQTPSGLVTAGGRVLTTAARGETLQSAIDTAYKAMDQIRFDGMHYRRDIGRKGLRRW